MARATVQTHLSLEKFAKILGIHPLHFNQVYVPDIAESRTCDQPIFQYSWQSADRIGREELANVIATAEAQLINYLGYYPMPAWIAREEVFLPRPWAPELFNSSGRDRRGFMNTLATRYKNVVDGGQRAVSLISAGVAIVYTDEDGDGYKETATITVATTVTEIDEIALFYPSLPAVDSNQIKDLTSVIISGGVATIKCRREQLVLNVFLESLDPTGLNGLTDSNFLTTIDVYRLYNNPQSQVQLIWDATAVDCYCNGDDSCPECGFTVQDGCLTVRDSAIGRISLRPANWNTTTLQFDSTTYATSREPDRARVWYRSGWRNMSLATPDISMDPLWERVITYLTASLLDRPICTCRPIQAQIQHWAEDLGKSLSTPGASVSFNLSARKVDNPFGTTRGALYAYEVANRYRSLV